MSVIIDNQFWNGAIGDSIRNKFATAVIGLPQEEPLFDLNQYPVKLMEGFVANSRNVLVIKKSESSCFEVKKDQFASPQNIFYVYGTSADEIIGVIEEKAAEIIAQIHTTEIVETQKNLGKSEANSQKIKAKFGVALQVPLEFECITTEDKFMWYKKEITSGSASLLLYEVPLSSFKNKKEIVSNIVKVRDSIGLLYIHGKEPCTDMITSDAYWPYFNKISIDNKKVYETKGTWELKGDFMSGPFINYVIMDSYNCRALVLEGFCYAPSKEKRDIMHELEAIIKTVTVSKLSL